MNAPRRPSARAGEACSAKTPMATAQTAGRSRKQFRGVPVNSTSRTVAWFATGLWTASCCQRFTYAEDVPGMKDEDASDSLSKRASVLLDELPSPPNVLFGRVNISNSKTQKILVTDLRVRE